MSYAYRIAHAAASRDWAAIDAALDAWVADRPSIAVGVAKAQRDASGQPDTLPPLDKPDPVTIHDLPPGTPHEVRIDGPAKVRKLHL